MTTEQAHLQGLYHRLTTDVTKLTAKLAALTTEAHAVQQQLSTEGHLDLGTYTDTLDTFANIETNNRQIDTLNARYHTAEVRLVHAQLLLPQAYFAKLDLDYGDGEPEAFYFGKVGYVDEHGDDLVYDWRAPVADTYYTNRTGATSYQANGRSIPVTVLNRQQFIINHDQLHQVIETNTAIGDPLLLAVLATDRSGGLQEITATIQQAQNAIIREQQHRVLLVDGVAGSGKTSVLLQRVAYLLYQHRQDWTPADVLILTPNTAFSCYIRGVLPALGEAEPLTATYFKLMQAVAKRFGLVLTTLAQHHLPQIAHLLERPLVPTPAGLNPTAYAQTQPADKLIDRLRAAWRWLEATDQVPEDVATWLDWDALAQQLRLEQLTAYDRLFLLICITGYQQTTTRALFVDEAQDYDADVWLMLTRLFSAAQCTIVGDHRQRMTGSAPELTDFFDQAKTLTLATSYRATGAITSFFATFAGDWVDLKAVQATGSAPVTRPLKDLATVLATLQSSETQSVGLITTDEAQATQLANQFSTAQLLLPDGSRTVQPGLNVLPLSVAKGLEFDHAIVYDWQAAFYTDRQAGQNRRYVAASRGTKTLTLLV